MHYQRSWDAIDSRCNVANLWSEARRSNKKRLASGDHRLPFEHDHDRLLFSTPVRRLADKTQVFPLDRSDAVRTRLTHSHEVANLARSMGVRLLHTGFRFPGLVMPRGAPAILATVGLAHDLGNPPFGHQGEAAISHWFTKNNVFDAGLSSEEAIPAHLHAEFLEFEGNAQAYRILTRLQTTLGGCGLDLTAATLAALMKYSTTCDARSKDNISTKKYGYFESEHEVVCWMRQETGLTAGQRHPLTWIMEAADDIAYSSLDIEDAMHKGIISPDDVAAILVHELGSEYQPIKDFISEKFRETRKNTDFSIRETREIMSSYLRTAFIENLINESVDDFRSTEKEIWSFTRTKPLMHGSGLLATLKKIAQGYVFVDADVRKIEADGYRIIGGLMDFYWHAITNRKDKNDLRSRPTDANAAFGMSKLSDNYLQCAHRSNYIDRFGKILPMRYKELRLLTDMVSGMSDGFAKAEYEFLKENEFIN